MAWQQRWQQWSAAVLARPLRERALIFGALLVVFGLVSYQFLLEPQKQQRQQLQQKTHDVRQRLQDVKGQLKQMQQQLAGPSPRQQQRQRIERWQQRLQQQRQDVTASTQSLLTPQQMLPLLRGFTQQFAGVKLLRLENLSPEKITLQPQAAEDEQDTSQKPQLYRHPVRLVLEGSYLRLLAYVRALEELPQRLGWQHLQLQVPQPDANRLQLELFTLSLDEEWLRV